MEKLVAPIEEKFQTSLESVGEYDPYSGISYLGIKDVLKAHFLIANFFYEQGSGIGGVGPRDMDLLHSTMYRQHIAYGATSRWKSKCEKCATLFFGLIKNHPFYDANKRTALLSLVYHLETIGLYLTCKKRDIEQLALDVANENLCKYSRFKDIAKKSYDKDDASVQYISYFLKKNSRQIDKRNYIVTFKDLKTILNKFGYDLQNATGSTVDVVRIIEHRRIFGIFGRKEKVGVRVVQIGFPNWTSQVSQSAVATIRKATKLTHDQGIDSQTFFKKADPISILISEYQEPLRRLADR